MEHLSPPPPLMVSEPGSFAEQTIVKRKPQILRRIISGGAFGAPVANKLSALEAEIAEGVVAPLHEEFPDVADWLEVWGPWEGKTWRELPWYFAESYFYRRVLEITGYFQQGATFRVDPFVQDKQEALAYGMADMVSLLKHVPADLSAEERLTLWLHRSLWGNRADLSNREVLAQTRHLAEAKYEHLLLIDHTAQVIEMLTSGQVKRLMVVSDNAGLELFADLFLAHEILTQDLVQTVTFQLKPQPFFVSDALLDDAAATITGLRSVQGTTMEEVATRLDEFATRGRMRLATHPFWAGPHFFSEFPEGLRTSLDQSDLIIFKGDVNYRRLIEDRHWPPTADLGAIASYMTSSFLALRTLKSEVIVGLDEGVAEVTAKRDPNWLINGERGVVQLVKK